MRTEVPVPTAALLDQAIGVLETRFGARDWRIPSDARIARKSTIYCLESAQARVKVALKVYLGEASGSATCALQAQGLQRFATLMQSGAQGFTLPEIHAHFPEHNAVLMEWVEALPLEQVLMRAALNPSKHGASIHLAGEWLNRFHGLSGWTEDSFDPLRYPILLDRRIRQFAQYEAVFGGDTLWHAGRQHLLKQVAALMGRGVSCAVIHGDFTSTNILLSPGRVTGVDLWANRVAPVAEDLTRMLVYLMMGDLFPVHARFVAVPPQQRRSLRALREGYGCTHWPEEEVLNFLLLFESMARWLALQARLAKRYRFNEQWKLKGVRRLVASLISC